MVQNDKDDFFYSVRCCLLIKFTVQNGIPNGLIRNLNLLVHKRKRPPESGLPCDPGGFGVITFNALIYKDLEK